MSSKRVVALATALTAAFAALPSAAPAQSGCPTTAPADAVTPGQLRELSARYVRDGLFRPAGTRAHERSVAWLKQELAATKDVSVREYRSALPMWEPKARAADGGADLARATKLAVRRNGSLQDVPISGGVPFSLPTDEDGIGGKLKVVEADEPITEASAKGRILVLKMSLSSIPYALFPAVAWYMTPDFAASAGGNYDRPFGGHYALTQRLVDAGKAGAQGAVVVFDHPRPDVAGYYGPHDGLYYTVPAVFVGVDEGEQLRRLAKDGAEARIATDASKAKPTAPNLVASLPGAQKHRTFLQSHTDGMTWVQDNGPVAIVALIKYFAKLPRDCRPTLEVLLTAGHLTLTEGYNAAEHEAKRLDKEFDEGTVGAVLTLEHLGTRAIEAAPRGGGKPGSDLRYDGKPEPTIISVSESPRLAQAVVGAVQRSRTDRTAVLRNVGASSATIPPNCLPGGDNTPFWQHLIPGVQIITGPWSLFGPSFGEAAVDFARMDVQTQIFADTILEIAPLEPRVVAGSFTAYREARNDSTPRCTDGATLRHAFKPSEQAPGPGAIDDDIADTGASRLTPRVCTSRRALRLRVRGVARRARVRSLTVSVSGQRTRRLRGNRRVVRVDLRGAPRGTVAVRIVVRTKKGRRYVDRRTYRTCTPR
jgi:hypothetical protein